MQLKSFQFRDFVRLGTPFKYADLIPNYPNLFARGIFFHVESKNLTTTDPMKRI